MKTPALHAGSVPADAMPRTLGLADDLAIPAEDALESVFAVIGKRGRGKTGCVRRMMEELCRLRMPFVAFDPVGILWGLRSSFDGSRAANRVLVVGGVHGDLPIDRRAGADVAKAIVARRIPHVVLDLSLEPKAAYRQFVREFADGLYRHNNESRHVFIEEAPELVPQRLRSDLAPTFEAVERLASRGRNRGIGVTMISQRSATIHKDVLACADHLICFGQTSPQDRKALKEWVEAKAADDRLKEFFGGLAGLGRQEGWFWSPEALDLFCKFRSAQFSTFHPDRTHLRRHDLLQVVPVLADMSDVVTALRDAMPSPRDEAVGDGQRRVADPAEALGLRRKIAELEGELTRERERTASVPFSVRKGAKEATTEMSYLADRLSSVAHRLEEAMRNGVASAPKAQEDDAVPAPVPTAIPPTTEPGKRHSSRHADPRSPRGRILCAIRALNLAGIWIPTRCQVAILARYMPGTGTLNTYFGALRTEGLVDYPSGRAVGLTPKGVEETPLVRPATQADMDEAIQSVLDSPHWRLLKIVKEAWPEAMDRDAVARAAGYAPKTGTVNTYFGRLHTLDLVVYGGRRTVEASPNLFVRAAA